MSGTVKQQLDSVFDPVSIAFIGASNEKGKWGELTLKQTLDAGFRGRIYPINPTQKVVQGLRSYPSVLDVPDEVELAVVVVPSKFCISAIEDCAKKGVKAAIVITAGFAETGESGRVMQDELIRVAKMGGVRVVGPNGMGVWSATSRLCLPLGFGTAPKPGPIAFISQSGSFGVSLVRHAGSKGYGFSRFVSSGNQADLVPTDYLEYCAEDPETRVIVFYLEGLADGHRFTEVARQVIKHKPIIVYKAGRSAASGKAMMSHTGSLSGSDEIFDAMCRQVGIIRAGDAVSAFDMAQALALQPLPRGKRVGIVARGGGFCVSVADQCGTYGLEVPTLDLETQMKIKPGLQAHTAMPSNPVDLGGDMRPLILAKTVRQVAEAEEVDGIISQLPTPLHALVDVPSVHSIAEAVDIMNRIPTETQKPVLLSAIAFKHPLVNDLLTAAGIPTYDNPADASRAMGSLMNYAETKRKLTGAVWENLSKSYAPEGSKVAAMAIIERAMAEGRTSLSEHEGKGVFAAYGIPVTKERLVRSVDELVEGLKDFDFPVVMKVDSPNIAHKTEAGVVMLNIGAVEQAVSVYSELIERARSFKPEAHIDGVLVQEMVSNCTECFVGVKRDAQFGPVVAFGLGGVFVEVLKDVSLRIAPLRVGDAGEMVSEIKGHKILAGTRGQAPRDVAALEDTLLKVSALALDLGEHISELDINPLMVGAEGQGVKAVDALIVLR